MARRDPEAIITETIVLQDSQNRAHTASEIVDNLRKNGYVLVSKPEIRRRKPVRRKAPYGYAFAPEIQGEVIEVDGIVDQERLNVQAQLHPAALQTGPANYIVMQTEALIKSYGQSLIERLGQNE